MAEEKKFGSVKRFGARYGRSLKQKFGEIEMEQRRKHKCPFCSKTSVKRLAFGIWQCRSCNTKFTGRAYSPVSINKSTEEVTETVDMKDNNKTEKETIEIVEKKEE